MTNSLKHRLGRLEEVLTMKFSCPECQGEGRCTLSMLDHDEVIPPGGCPRCGLGSQVVIRWPKEPVPT